MGALIGSAKGCVINKCRTDAVILDLVESKKLSIAALRFIFLRKNQFKRTSLNRPLLFSCPLANKAKDHLYVGICKDGLFR